MTISLTLHAAGVVFPTLRTLPSMTVSLTLHAAGVVFPTLRTLPSMTVNLTRQGLGGMKARMTVWQQQQV